MLDRTSTSRGWLRTLYGHTRLAPTLTWALFGLLVFLTPLGPDGTAHGASQALIPPTPPCTLCHLFVNHVTLACNPDGTVHWTARVYNIDRCTQTTPYRTQLQIRRSDRPWLWVNAQAGQGTASFPHGETLVEGDICYQFPTDTLRMRVKFALDDTPPRCLFDRGWSNGAPPCAVTPTCDPSPTVTPVGTSTPGAASSTPARTHTHLPTATPDCALSPHHYFAPQAGSPPNGGTVGVGDRFVLDLKIDDGHHRPDIRAAQAYMTFTYNLIKNVVVGQSGCVLTNTLTADQSTFDAVLQNEVCNGPNPCFFRGVHSGPGIMAFASVYLGSCAEGCAGNFRIAEAAFCAYAPGRAVIHWQFAPPDPPTRDTQIVEPTGVEVEVPFCYEDYVLNVIEPTSTPTRTATPTPTSIPQSCETEVYHYFTPQPGSPPNGGTVRLGDKFILDLMVHSGSHDDLTGQQSYLTFTHTIIKNARATVSSCVLTGTVTADLTTFDTLLQNEVCNDGCFFRGNPVPPGYMAFASGALGFCSNGCGGNFRVAQIAFCAVGIGQAVIHWQFSPPDPPTRDTQIVDADGDLVHVSTCYIRDYVINVLEPTGTLTTTPTGTIPPTRTITPIGTITNTRTITRTRTATRTTTNTPIRDSSVLFEPQEGAPPNGGTANVGDRFVLDLMLEAGSHPDVTGQQSYLTFTHDLIKNARVGQIATDCVLTSTVSPDLNAFDMVLQNEVCNGPGICIFREMTLNPGSFAYASGRLNGCGDGCGGRIRMAQVGLCAIAPGQAVLHWQFTPPDPPNRDTTIITQNGEIIQNRALFTDYVINITNVTSTPTAITTPSSTPIPTGTPTPACGLAWRIAPSANVGTVTNRLEAVAALSPNDIWAVGYYINEDTVNRTLTMHWDGTQWSIVPSPNPGAIVNQLYGVAVISANDAWAVGTYVHDLGTRALTLHWDGTQWNAVPINSSDFLNEVVAIASNDVWAMGFGSFMHWDGTQWSHVPSGRGYWYGMAANSTNDVWAVGRREPGTGASTLVEHWNGSAWSVVPSQHRGIDSAFNAVTTVSANDAWAVGYYATITVTQTLIEHWDGTQWSIVPSPNVGQENNSLTGVVAMSANDVWAVGYHRTGATYHTLILHWDGSTWSIVPNEEPGTGNNLFTGIAALSPDNLWAVGYFYSGASGERTLVERYSNPCALPPRH